MLIEALLLCVALQDPESKTLDVRLVLQNDFVTEIDLKGTGATNRALSVGGSALVAGKSDAEKDEPKEKPIARFLDTDDDKIRKRFAAYLKTHAIDAQTTDWIVLDMEHPVHPSDLGQAEYDTNRDKLIEAFKRRIAIAREALPKARLSLYGVVVGNSRGLVENEGFKTSMKGYQRAAELGMFDALDYLVPVIYQRWGPDDRIYKTLEEYTRQTVKMSATLKRKDGSSIPLAPLLSVRVFNTKSDHDRKPVSAESAKLQLKVLAECPEVKMVGFWSADEKPKDVNRVDFLKQLDLKPAK